MNDAESGYRGDLAHVQDAGFGDFARGAAPGDQRVELRIVAPPAIDAGLAAFMEGWREAHPHDPRAGLFE